MSKTQPAFYSHCTVKTTTAPIHILWESLWEVCMKIKFCVFRSQGAIQQTFQRILQKVRSYQVVMSPPEMDLIYCSCLFWKTWNAEISYAFNKVKKNKAPSFVISLPDLMLWIMRFVVYAMHVLVLFVQGEMSSTLIRWGGFPVLGMDGNKTILSIIFKHVALLENMGSSMVL